MHGYNVGELNIYLDNGTLSSKLKNITGEQGFQWFQLQIDISSQVEFRIVLEAVVCVSILFINLNKILNFFFFKYRLETDIMVT